MKDKDTEMLEEAYNQATQGSGIEQQPIPPDDMYTRFIRQAIEQDTVEDFAYVLIGRIKQVLQNDPNAEEIVLMNLKSALD